MEMRYLYFEIYKSLTRVFNLRTKLIYVVSFEWENYSIASLTQKNIDGL